MTSETAAFFDQMGRDYIAPDDGYVRAYHEHRFNTAERMLWDVKPGSLYDYGCGSGEMLLRLPDWRPARGCDISAEMVRLAKQRTGLDIEQGGVREFIAEREHYHLIVALNVLPYLTAAEEATFFNAIRERCDYVLVSHANALFDLVTFNRFTVAYYADRLVPLLRGADHDEAISELKALMTNADGPSRHNEQHKGSERDQLQKRLVDPFLYCPDGYDVVRFQGVNPHPVPPALLEAHPDWKSSALATRIEDPTLERLLCSQFQVLLKPRIDPRTASTIKPPLAR